MLSLFFFGIYTAFYYKLILYLERGTLWLKKLFVFVEVQNLKIK